MITIEIKSHDTNYILYTHTAEDATLRTALLAALAVGANLGGANLSGANLGGANLRCVNLSGAYLRGADLYGTNFSGADLSGANLRGTNLEGASLRGANLEGAYLRRANLEGAYLYGANLKAANLNGANLSGANLSGAKLKGADLGGAYLSRANLSGSNLNGANLKGADLNRVNLKGADLGLNLTKLITIPDLDGQILRLVTADPLALNMDQWHTCETTHCRAGWAITLAGAAGATLDALWGPITAGALIYATSYPDLPVPNFLASNEDALADIRERAALAHA